MIKLPPKIRFEDERLNRMQDQLWAALSAAEPYPAPLWDDARVPLSATTLGGSKDPAFAKLRDDGAGSQGVFAYDYSATQEQELYFALQLPHSYVEGTDLYPHVHWTHKATGSGAVVWGIEYTIASPFKLVGPSAIIRASDRVADVYTHQVTKLPVISGKPLAISAMLVGRVFRDATNAADDYASVASLLEIDFHHQVNSLGSIAEYRKEG